jgi:hypothetical protein
MCTSREALLRSMSRFWRDGAGGWAWAWPLASVPSRLSQIASAGTSSSVAAIPAQSRFKNTTKL